MHAGTRQPLAHPDRRVTALAMDVTDTAQIQAAAGQADSLDILINNAGVALYDDLNDRAALERSLAVNFDGVDNAEEDIFPIPCQRPRRPACAAARPRRSSATTRRRHKWR